MRILAAALISLLIPCTATISCGNENGLVTADDIPVALTPGCG